MLLLTCAAVLASCPGPRTAAASRVEVRWRVDTITQTASGGDVDDAEPSVFLVGDAADAFVAPLGGAAGVCETDRPDELAAVCGGRSSALVTRLVCGHDPHVDRVYCFDATRTEDGLALSRRVYDVPAVDGPAPPPRLVESREVARIDLASSCEVVVGKTSHRDVVDDGEAPP